MISSLIKPYPPSLPHAIQQLQSQIHALRSQNHSLRVWAEQVLGAGGREVLGEWAGKVGHLVFRQAREKMHLQSQIEKSRAVQGSMRGEVIALKEMVQAAVEDYEKQLQRKEALLKEKNQEIQILIKQIRALQGRNSEDSTSIRLDQSRNTHRQSLEIIQEESEHATHSSAATLRDFQQERIKLPQSVISEAEVSCQPVTAVVLSSPEVETENCEPKFAEHKRTKTFIDHFRKTIGESFSEKEEERPPALKQQNLLTNNSSNSNTILSNNNNRTSIVSQITQKEPLRQLSSNDQVSKPFCFSQNLKQTQKDPKHHPNAIPFLPESNSVSKSSSSSDLIISTEAERIPLPKKFQTPINLMSFKKKETPVARIMTEPSPQRLEKAESNSYFSSKPSHSHKRIFHEKKSSCEKSQHSMEDSKSVKSSLSREKIKITAKMMDDTPQKRQGGHGKALVYLGGKSVFRKFLLQLKNALKQYSIISAFPQVKYEGGRRNGMRWGQGKLLYQNGCIYEGQFKEGVRWGRGRLSLNGISIYEGDWVSDRISGQGYIKSMRFMGSGGGAIFNEASYCGNLQNNRLHGIGTLFLNGKEKIVTKFAHGTPIGELTYYNIHEIEFGVWPSE